MKNEDIVFITVMALLTIFLISQLNIVASADYSELVANFIQ